MLQSQEFNAALFTFKCSKVNVVKKLSRLFNDFFPFFDQKSRQLERHGLEAEPIFKQKTTTLWPTFIPSLEISYCKSYNDWIICLPLVAGISVYSLDTFVQVLATPPHTPQRSKRLLLSTWLSQPTICRCSKFG